MNAAHLALIAVEIGMIDNRDIADSAVAAATSETWDGETLELTGPAAIDFCAVAAAIGQELGREVTYVPVSPAVLGERARIHAGEWVAQLLTDYCTAYSRGWGDFTTNAVAKLTGHEPRSIADSAREVLAPADNKDQHSRVAVVTGASRGMGRACAERLARDGFSIVINYASNKAEANAAVNAITSQGAKAIAVATDVADEVAVADLFDLTERTFGGVDVVVHAAARMSLAPLVEINLSVLDEMHRVNIRGTFVIDQQAARRVRRGGSIVNFSSSVVGRILPGYTGYAASKGAVDAVSLILASELRGRDVNVNAIAPGPTATSMFLDGKDRETIARFAQAAPLERLGTPADIAELVAFLTSPAGHWVNGQTIRVNGGIH